MWRKTRKQAFAMFYTLIKRGLLTDQSEPAGTYLYYKEEYCLFSSALAEHYDIFSAILG